MLTAATRPLHSFGLANRRFRHSSRGHACCMDSITSAWPLTKLRRAALRGASYPRPSATMPCRCTALAPAPLEFVAPAQMCGLQCPRASCTLHWVARASNWHPLQPIRGCNLHSMAKFTARPRHNILINNFCCACHSSQRMTAPME